VTKAAAACSLLLGLGFGLPAVYGAWYFAHHDRIWFLMGFPTYGEGPFERWGVPTTVPLLVGFAAVCAAEVAVGVLLWGGAGAGTWLAIALVPLELAFWTGFALPFGFVLGAVRTVLVVLTLLEL
jgi:hypothetical protein